MDTHKEHVRKFYSVLWDAHNKDEIQAILHDDFTFRGSLGQEKRGHTGFAEYVDMVHEALGEYRCIIEELVAESDRVFAKMKFTGIHKREFLGFSPTQQRVTWNGCALFTFRGDKVADLWVLGDLTSLKKQLETGHNGLKSSSRMKWLLSFGSVIVLMAAGTSNSAQNQVSDQPVQGCPLVLGDASFNTTVSRGDAALLLKMEPVRYGSCSRFKALRLISPEGKKLKPRKIKPKRSSRGHISIGVGRGSGGSTGGSVSVHGSPSGGYGGSNRITYVFERGLPKDTPDWIWAIKIFDRCTKTREERHIPVDHLVLCEAD